MPITLALLGCASSVNHDAYAVSDEKSEPIINVIRDNQSGSDHTKKCKTNFYINNTKVGEFATKDVSNYQLAPGHYTFAVDNCQGRCSTYALDVEIQQGEHQKFTLSADASGQPFIIGTKIK